MINNPHLANQLVSICYALLGFSIFLLGIGVLYGGYQVQFDEQTSNAVIVLITLTMITGLAIILLYAPAIEAVFGGLGLKRAKGSIMSLKHCFLWTMMKSMNT